MLEVHIPETENYNHKTGEFITTKEVTIQLEHSLVSLSKWESKWKKPYYSDKEKTKEELADYYQCMCITKNVDPVIFKVLPTSIINQIHEYINDSMTATWFNDKSGRKGNHNGEMITSELIYYWMVAYGIPFECQKWHLNRLLTLIKVCNEKNAPSKKMSKNDILRQNSSLNAARRAKSRKRV